MLVLLNLLAPVGSVGITATPEDAESSITAPRPIASELSESLVDHVDHSDVLDPRVFVAAPPAVTVETWELPAPGYVPAVRREGTIGSRAPPV